MVEVLIMKSLNKKFAFKNTPTSATRSNIIAVLLPVTRINLDETTIKAAVPLYASACCVTDTARLGDVKQREKNGAEAAFTNTRGNLQSGLFRNVYLLERSS